MKIIGGIVLFDQYKRLQYCGLLLVGFNPYFDTPVTLYLGIPGVC